MNLINSNKGQMNFSQALIELKKGNRVQRNGWNGANMYIELQDVDEDSKMTRPYLYIRDAQGSLVPWTPSQTDLLTSDWRCL